MHLKCQRALCIYVPEIVGLSIIIDKNLQHSNPRCFIKVRFLPKTHKELKANDFFKLDIKHLSFDPIYPCSTLNVIAFHGSSFRQNDSWISSTLTQKIFLIMKSSYLDLSKRNFLSEAKAALRFHPFCCPRVAVPMRLQPENIDFLPQLFRKTVFLCENLKRNQQKLRSFKMRSVA